jgi:hypothetical protein
MTLSANRFKLYKRTTQVVNLIQLTQKESKALDNQCTVVDVTYTAITTHVCLGVNQQTAHL